MFYGSLCSIRPLIEKNSILGKFLLIIQKPIYQMADLAAPVRVAPLIKFGRWSLLSAGILYGLFHQGRLSRREAGIREVELKQKAIRDEKLSKEKKIAAEREIKELENLAGVKS